MNNPLLYEAELLEITGLKRSTVSSWMEKGKLPRKLFSSRRYGRVWSREDVYKALCKKNDGQTERGFVNV